jgi:diguanylate cyclase (GGDEF)-like protein
MAKIIINNIRTSDISARYGGEELAVILPKTNIESAFEVAERIRKNTYTYFKRSVGATISIGVSSFDQEVTTSENLLKRADQALYKAKKQGKNMVVKAV